MTWDRVAIVEQGLDSYLETARPAPHRLTADAPLQQGAELTVARALALFEDQLASRQLDVASRELKKTNRSFYTIGSAGHENNALVGARLRIDDPTFLHYRSGAFMMARARQLPGSTPILDTLLGVVASARIRSARAVTRCGAARRSGCRRRRALSRVTFRRRWASRSACRGRSASAWRTACPPTPSSPARSATQARTTRPRSRPSTPPAMRRGWACRCHCC